jgi:hypothetical protein
MKEIGLVKGRIAISGWDNLGSALAIIFRVKELLPEIESSALSRIALSARRV